MKRFLINCLIFILLLIAVDFVIGSCIRYAQTKAVSGHSLKNHERESVIAPELLILGSSRAAHHYAPGVFSDSLHLETYNAGEDGNGIILMYPLFRCIAERQLPEMVIYDIHPIFDFYDDDLSRYMRYVRPLWGINDTVDNAIRLIDPLESVKLRSHLYRYNSSIPSLIKGLSSAGEKFDHGFMPLAGTPADIDELPFTDYSHHGYSSVKLRFLEDMMLFCDSHGIRLLFMISPSYEPIDTQVLDYLRTRSTQYHYDVVDYSDSPSFRNRQELFNDPGHLNADGAILFSTELVKEIRGMDSRE